ncbi:MAG: TonB-dependent receptor [Bacteroidales bacterium]
MKKLMVFCGIIMFPICGFSQAAAQNKQQTESVKQDRLDSIVVHSTRAGRNTPVAYTSITKKQMQEQAASHSLPMLLALEPSVVATTEGGLGLGYSKLSVRGTDDSRTNVTLNGIALNDGESQQVFWVNLPSIQGFLQSVQLQRGVGTSMNGPGAFGASINMETTSPGSKPYGAAQFSLGSYQTYMTTIAAGSGVLKNGLSLDVIYSHNSTNGYIRNAKANLNSLYASLGWRNDNNSLKFNYIFGDQITGITWEGVDPKMYEKDRRYNVAGQYFDEAGNVHYYDNETDNYKQHFVQGVYTHQFNPYLTWNTTFNFTKGDGYYENYKYDTKFSKYGIENQVIDKITHKKSDFIIQQAMDNYYYAATTNFNYTKGIVRATAGAAYSFYDGDHFGDVLWSKYNQNIPDNFEWYMNNGKKNDVSVFIKAEVDVIEKLTVFVDLQYRHVGYKLAGPDKDFVSLDWDKNYNFFNPKAGLTYNASARSKFYASVAVGHKEPTRSDIKESIKAAKADEIKQERLIDYEIGYKYIAPKLTVSANVYFMEYKDQLVATGRLSETGYVIKENIPDSYRRGIELAAAWQIIKPVRFDANLTLSQNKLRNFTAYFDTYDNINDWNPVAQTTEFYSKSNLTLSPEIVGMAMVTVNPCKTVSLSLNAKYVGKQYMDNSSADIAKVPAYVVAGFNASKDFKMKNNSALQLSFTVDNLFNNTYYSYGWIAQSRFMDGSAPEIYQGVFAQAEINFIAKVAYKF